MDKTMNCLRCKKEVPRKTANQKYCATCNGIAAREKAILQRQKKNLEG